MSPGYIPKPKWIVVPPIFTADISVVPKRRTHGLSGSLEWQSNSFDTNCNIVFSNWDFPVLPLPDKTLWTGSIWRITFYFEETFFT